MDAGPTRAVDAGGGDRRIAGKPGSETGPPSSRLTGLVGGDLPGHQRVDDGEGSVRFAPGDGGPILELRSRLERRFLGRTEIAVFETGYETSFPQPFAVELRHAGKFRRSGVTVTRRDDTAVSERVAEAFDADPELSEVALPLDFTHFEVRGGKEGCRARVELVGASHVAVALPPMRSYVRLYPDQREALVRSFTEVGRILSGVTLGADDS